MNIEELKYPIGKFQSPEKISDTELLHLIDRIETFPARLQQEVQSLNDAQLDTAYRPDGWTVRQVVNHCADSHMNALTRVKLTLTEDSPTVKPYYEERWAELADTKTMPIGPALQMLAGIHARWVVLLRNMNETDLSRKYIHPQYGKEFRLDEFIALYAWHGDHHLAHITSLKNRMGWK